MWAKFFFAPMYYVMYYVIHWYEKKLDYSHWREILALFRAGKFLFFFLSMVQPAIPAIHERTTLYVLLMQWIGRFLIEYSMRLSITWQ